MFAVARTSPGAVLDSPFYPESAVERRVSPAAWTRAADRGRHDRGGGRCFAGARGAAGRPGVLEFDCRQLELGYALDRGERNRQVLDGETGRVEDGDLVRAAAPLRSAGEHVSELRRVGAHDPAGFDGMREVAVVRRLFPVVAED